MTPYYQEAGITIYNADNREVISDLATKRFDLLLTDPPYGIGFARAKAGHGVHLYKTGVLAGKPRVKPRDYGIADWDDQPADREVLDAFRVLCEKQIIWGANYFHLPPSRCWLVWDKMRGNTDFADAELAWTNMDSVVRRIQWRWNGFLQQNSGDHKEERWHPTQKPLSVMAWCLTQAIPAKSVLDPWMGTGTTLIAAKQAGTINAVGIEINEKYCEIAAKRLSQGVLSFA